MKIRVIIAVLILLAIGLIGGTAYYLISQQPADQEPAPATTHEEQKVMDAFPPDENAELVVSQTLFDFGTVSFNDVVDRTVQLESNGTSSVSILNVKSACNCLTAQVEGGVSTIEAGESVSMKVTLDTAKVSNPFDGQRISYSVIIESTDANEPKTTLTFKAKLSKVPEASDKSANDDSSMIVPVAEEDLPESLKEAIKEDPAPSKKVFNMTAKQWEFIPASITVNVGDEVQMNITSSDVAHGISLPQFGVSSRLEPGQTTTVKFKADKAGSYSFFCSVACGQGHGSMRGTLIVK